MSILSTLFGKRSRRRYSYPESQRFFIEPIPDKYDREYRIQSRKIQGVDYHVNVARLTCTCEDFEKSRRSFNPQDIRRVCRHLYAKLWELKIERRFDPLLRLMIRHGRRYRRFHHVVEGNNDIVFGYSRRSSKVTIFALLDEHEIVAAYDLDRDTWADTPASAYSSMLRDKIKRTFLHAA